MRTLLAGPALPLLLLAAPGSAPAQSRDTTAAGGSAACPSCAEWNAPQRPFRVFGNTYYVGTRGLSAVLITSPDGHVLIDAGLSESAPLVMASIRALGFAVEDVRLILNSHAHFDHAGGIAAVQRASGAPVAASPASAPVLERGTSGRDDPQYGVADPFPPVSTPVRLIHDGEAVRVGPLTVTARFTPGHTPGGTTWSWRSCEEDRCLDLVYADSETPVSAEGFHFTRSPAYPTVLQDFERGFTLLETIPCDLLLTPHPGASGLWERVAADSAGFTGLVEPGACRRYAAGARAQLARRVARERAEQTP